MEKRTLRQRLQSIQLELVAPKSQYNSFGKYYYRNCEDILEALKPLLEKYECTLSIADDIVMVGDRYYVKAKATLKAVEGEDEIFVSAFAREELDKKGMDGSQITGASSSYARKYALNGLFLIDDTKDSDTTNVTDKTSPTLVKQTELVREPTISPETCVHDWDALPTLTVQKEGANKNRRFKSCPKCNSFKWLETIK